MATASTATKRNRMSSVSPKLLEASLRTAKDAIDAAYGKHTVKQPDGSTLDLCLQGRLDRAYRMMGDADAATREKLQPAIKALSQQVQKMQALAAKASSDYTAAAIAAGQVPAELPIPECDCEGCHTGQLQAAYFAAEAELRHVTMELLTPDDADGALPVLAMLMGNDSKVKVMLHLKKISDAQVEYAAACAAFGQRPQWARVLS